MSDPYDFPPPPSYELSQQGNDSKITPEDHFHHLTPSPKPPFHNVSSDSDIRRDKVTSEDTWHPHDKVEALQHDRKATTPRGARPRRPLPPRPADLQNQPTAPATFAHDPDVKNIPLPNYIRDTSLSRASLPLNSPVISSFNTSTARYDAPSRPYPDQKGSDPHNYTFAPGPPRGNFHQHHAAPARVPFDPYVAYGGSNPNMPSSSQKAGRVDPASLYASSVSSHVQTSSRPYQTSNIPPFRPVDSSSTQPYAPSPFPHPSSHSASAAPPTAGRRWAMNEADMTNHFYRA